MKRLLKRRIVIVMLSLILVYSAGYVVCHTNKTIVHHTASAGGACSFHGVDVGDYKIFSFAPAMAAFYTPLRYMEPGCWKLAKPLGGSC